MNNLKVIGKQNLGRFTFTGIGRWIWRRQASDDGKGYCNDS
ncbi:hypothetical protein [Listeria newyorkensis]|nr:hypothetical protein [Listeria newyorkensis]SQC55627.1 Uncharacterised protein [Listeria newyorkensis]